jgi:hypothetical protein
VYDQGRLVENLWGSIIASYTQLEFCFALAAILYINHSEIVSRMSLSLMFWCDVTETGTILIASFKCVRTASVSLC